MSALLLLFPLIIDDTVVRHNLTVNFINNMAQVKQNGIRILQRNNRGRFLDFAFDTLNVNVDFALQECQLVLVFSEVDRRQYILHIAGQLLKNSGSLSFIDSLKFPEVSNVLLILSIETRSDFIFKTCWQCLLTIRTFAGGVGSIVVMALSAPNLSHSAP